MRLERLWEDDAPDQAVGDGLRGAGMPAELQAAYGGELLIPIRRDRPTLLANFVSTLDGIVALGAGEPRGGGPISGSFEPDRFVMGLLRAVADVMVVGAGTIRGGRSTHWTAGHMHEPSADAFARWRAAIGLEPVATTVIVTGSGEVRLAPGGLDDPSVPVVFATTPSGAAQLSRAGLPPHVRVVVGGRGRELTGGEILAVVRDVGGSVVLSEGGPHLLGGLVAADAIDELFLTLAPQLIGRGTDRLGLTEGVGLRIDDGQWHELRSIRRSTDHLFLRYRRRSDAVHED